MGDRSPGDTLTPFIYDLTGIVSYFIKRSIGLLSGRSRVVFLAFKIRTAAAREIYFRSPPPSPTCVWAETSAPKGFLHVESGSGVCFLDFPLLSSQSLLFLPVSRNLKTRFFLVSGRYCCDYSHAFSYNDYCDAYAWFSAFDSLILGVFRIFCSCGEQCFL